MSALTHDTHGHHSAHDNHDHHEESFVSKYIFSQEEVGFLNLLVSKELLDWQSILTN